jgi:hypothetical protein
MNATRPSLIGISAVSTCGIFHPDADCSLIMDEAGRLALADRKGRIQSPLRVHLDVAQWNDRFFGPIGSTAENHFMLLEISS